MFWFDEMRFCQGFYILSTISDEEYFQAVKRFVSNFDHTFFQIFSILLQIVRYYSIKIFINQDIQPYMLMDSDIGLSICVTILSLSFILSIIFLNKILLNSGACKKLRIIIICCFALSSSILPYSRHLLPYDLATSIYLLSILFIIRNKYCFSGITCMFSILTYNGFSATFITTIIFSICFIITNENRYFKKLLIYASGFATVLLLIQSLAYITNINYIEGLFDWAEYAQKHQQGDFGLGYMLIFEYFWQTESLFSLLILFPFVFIRKLFKYSMTNNTIFFGIFFVFFIFGLMILNSDIKKNAVMYSRTLNQIVPFICICIGCFIYYIHSKVFVRKIKFILIFLILITYSYNVHPIIKMEFPKDILLKSQIISENTFLINEYVTDKDDLPKKLNNQLYITNCSQIYPGITKYNKYIFNNALWSKRHPYFYKPYQFMHFNFNERSILHENPPIIRYGY